LNTFDRFRTWRFRQFYLLKALLVGGLRIFWRRYVTGSGQWVRVFISSTYADLRVERFAVSHELSRFPRHYHVLMMEKHLIGRQDEKETRALRPGSVEELRDNTEYALNWSRENVAKADIVIIVLGSRHGFRPWKGQSLLLGEGVSITFLEAECAHLNRKLILVYRLRRPLNDENDFCNRYSWAKDWAFPNVKPKDQRTDTDDLKHEQFAEVLRPIDKYLGHLRIRQIDSGDQLIRTVRRDVDNVATLLLLVCRFIFLFLAASLVCIGWFVYRAVRS
jgi:hypothetical protein